jgi:PAS domain S-box-containing protein
LKEAAIKGKRVTDVLNSERLARLAVVPILLFAAAIVIFYWLDIETVAENEVLLALLNLLFSSSITLLVSYLAARSYLREGSTATLFLGSGMLTIGVTTTLVGLIGPHINALLTLHNVGVFVAGSCFMASAISAFIGVASKRQLHSSSLTIGASYIGLTAVIILVAAAAMHDVLPPFIIPGRGATMLRQIVLGGGIIQFGLAALFFRVLYARSRSGFLQWYSLGLILYTVGLMGVWLTTPGTLLNWTSRSAQFLAGPYFLAAILTLGQNWTASIREALQESEDRFRTLADNIPQLCWMANFDGWIFWYNKRWYEYTGTTPEQMEGWGWQSIHDPEMLPQVLERWKSSIATGKAFDMTLLLRGPYGVFRPFLTRVVPIFDREGKVVRWFGTNTDISERKEIEETLRRERDFSSAIFDTAGALVVVIDKEGRITRFNKACEAITGYSSTEVEGRVFWEFLIQPEELHGVRRAWEALHAGDFPNKHENHWVAKDGSVRLVEWSNTAIVDPDGEIGYIIGTGIDITERKRAEQELQKSEHEKTLVLNNASEIIAYHDTDHNLKWANRAYLDATGSSLQEIKGKKCYHAWGLDRLCNECPVRMAIETGEVQSSELIPQNQSHWPADQGAWAINAAPVKDASGNIIGAIEIAHDITERKRAEEELKKRTEALKRTNTDLEQFAYIASHDLQSPLRNVEGFVKLLSKRYKGKLDEKADEYINYIYQGVKDMQTLILDILEYSKVRDVDRKFTNVNTSLCISKAIFNLGDAITEKNADITYDEPMPKVIGDSAQLTSLFQNLIGNAIKFCTETPTIHIAVKNEGQEYIFSVRDNGIGIDPKNLR